MKYCLVFQLILSVFSNVCEGYPLCQAYRHNAILVKTVDQPGMVFISREFRSHAGRSRLGQGPRDRGGNLSGQGLG